MEPMTLGSPPASPGQSPTTNPNFLPAFLLGEHQPSNPRPNSISPTKSRQGPFKLTSTPGTENRGLSVHQRLYQSSSPPDQPQTSFNLSSVVEKAGPPSKSLFDTIDSPLDNYNSSRTETRNNPHFSGPSNFSTPQKNFSRNLNESLQKSYKRPAENMDNLWVTILGFPPHASSLVLAQFAQCGAIVDKKFPPEGNWVNLKYSTQFEVAKALSFNGKLISNSIMVGVVPCTNMEMNKENANTLNNHLNDSALLNRSVTSPNRARPLTQSFVQRQATDVIQPQNVPQKSTGIVSKAMEYVFGW